MKKRPTSVLPTYSDIAQQFQRSYVKREITRENNQQTSGQK